MDMRLVNMYDDGGGCIKDVEDNLSDKLTVLCTDQLLLNTTLCILRSMDYLTQKIYYHYGVLSSTTIIIIIIPGTSRKMEQGWRGGVEMPSLRMRNVGFTPYARIRSPVAVLRTYRRYFWTLIQYHSALSAKSPIVIWETQYWPLRICTQEKLQSLSSLAVDDGY